MNGWIGPESEPVMRSGPSARGQGATDLTNRSGNHVSPTESEKKKNKRREATVNMPNEKLIYRLYIENCFDLQLQRTACALGMICGSQHSSPNRNACSQGLDSYGHNSRYLYATYVFVTKLVTVGK
jgi:hypothetical protein